MRLPQKFADQVKSQLGEIVMLQGPCDKLTKMKVLKEDAVKQSDAIFDLYTVVDELHGLSSKEINRLLRDSENYVVCLNAGKNTSVQIDIEKVALFLPLHLLAVLLSSAGRDVRLGYLIRGIRILHSLGDLATRHAKFEQVLLEEEKATEQILDLVFYMLLVLARYDQGKRSESNWTIKYAALVACSLHLLTLFVSPHWHDVVNVLFAHPKVDIFIEAAFDAVRKEIEIFQFKLRTLSSKLLGKKVMSYNAERIAQVTTQHCEASLQALHSLCLQKLFRERLIQNKELCKKGGLFLLALSILKFQVPSLFAESPYLSASLSRMKSKIIAVLVLLCETESYSYLDEVASSSRSMCLGMAVAFEVLELLKTVLHKELKQIEESSDTVNPKGHLFLNAMRLADIFSDDSNFRGYVMSCITPDLANISALTPGDFSSNWCAVDTQVLEEDATLLYDPFRAAGTALLQMKGNGSTTPSMTAPCPDDSINACTIVGNSISAVAFAPQRTAFLVKIFANLHCYIPDICKEQEKNQFFNSFVKCLVAGPLNSSNKLHFWSEAQTAVRICENLCTLCDRAIQLVPNLLNEEDVQLLSGFLVQLHESLCPSKPEIEITQEEPMVEYVREKHENTFKAMFEKYHQSDCWAKYANPELIERDQTNSDSSNEDSAEHPPFAEKNCERANDQISEEAQSTGGYTPLSMVQHKEVRHVRDAEAKTKDPSDGTLCLNEYGMKTTKVPSRSIKKGFTPQTSERIDKGIIEKKQSKKRKRIMLNNEKIALIENALDDEPDMQENEVLLNNWTQKLRHLGDSDLTPSGLKIWKHGNASIDGKPATARQQELLSRGIGLSSLRSSAPKSCSIPNQPCDNVQNRSSHKRAMPTSENQKENHQTEPISATAWNQYNSKYQTPNGHDTLQQGTINDQSHHSSSNDNENDHFEPTSRDTIRNHSHQHSNQHSGPVATPSSSHSNSIGRGSSSSTRRKEPEIDFTKLVYDMGQFVRTHVSVRYESWDIVPMLLKEKIWSDVNAVYLLPTSYKTKAFSRMSEVFRDAKYQVRKKYDMFDNDVERKRNCPPNIRQEDWEEFMDRKSTEAAKERRVKGKHAREQVTTYQVTGRMGAARIGHEMKLENPEQPVTRTQLYLASHRRQDGSCATKEEKERLDKNQEIAASDSGSTLLDIDHDPVAQVCARDKRGNVRALGCHVTKTQVPSSAPVQEHLQKERRKCDSLENKVANMEDRMSEMKREMTEFRFTFTNISQNLSNSIADLRTALVNIQVPQQFGMHIQVPQQFRATQHRLPMDSFTPRMGDPRYMHPTSQTPKTPAATECECVIKTFGGTAVAKGRAVIAYSEAPDGTCQFIIDEILDFGAQLYEVDSSATVLGDKPIGSMIRWPKMFVTFTS